MLKASAAPFSANFRAEAVLPAPWQAVDPAAGGIAVAIAGLFDATIPGGAGWTSKASGWTYRNDAGAIAGITRIRIRNLSKNEAGRLGIRLKAAGAAATLPSAASVDASVTFGAADECAAMTFQGPGGAAPRCEGDAAHLACR
jgi:hypothetical protein